MTYRDDTEALLARLAVLEAQESEFLLLRRRWRELARENGALRDQVASLTRQLASLSTERAAPVAAPPPPLPGALAPVVPELDAPGPDSLTADDDPDAASVPRTRRYSARWGL